MEQQEVIVGLNGRVGWFEKGEEERTFAIATLGAEITAIEVSQRLLATANGESGHNFFSLDKIRADLKGDFMKEIGNVNRQLGREVQRSNEGILEMQDYFRNFTK